MKHQTIVARTPRKQNGFALLTIALHHQLRSLRSPFEDLNLRDPLEPKAPIPLDPLAHIVHPSQGADSSGGP